MTAIRARMKKGQMRRDKQPQAHTRDSYRLPKRSLGASRCPDCGAVYDKGRWTWHALPGQMHQLLCPACQRIHEQAPAGEISFHGDYLLNRRDEVLALLRHQADGESEEHPLERIMDVQQDAEHIVVHTTGAHLIRRLGAAMLHAHQGVLELSYRDNEGLLRAHWTRSSGT
ncbi:BCAM0308 family protein [Paraburkholderia sp. RL17-373-BIF-A]|uniref:BCAM0308 family protein n=1 Tax=Paraburkholderia sp. RL17-373-BIF-A TaxID=3031629 RepID=UPI0038B8B6AA